MLRGSDNLPTWTTMNHHLNGCNMQHVPVDGRVCKAWYSENRLCFVWYFELLDLGPWKIYWSLWFNSISRNWDIPKHNRHFWLRCHGVLYWDSCTIFGFSSFGCIVDYNNGWSPILLARCGIGCSAIPCQIRYLCDMVSTIASFNHVPPSIQHLIRTSKNSLQDSSWCSWGWAQMEMSGDS